VSGWIGVDLDGTLAEYGGWKGPTHIGAPVPRMLARVQRWMEEGQEVRIFTARVSGPDGDEARKHIQDWLLEHLGVSIPVTNEKDYGMVELWDDRAIQIRVNTGERADGLAD
jgi:hypothetical protein